MREFDRVATITLQMRKAEQEEHWWRTAVQVAYLENTVRGSLFGKKWKVRQPKDYFDQWMSTMAEEEKQKDRLNRARARHLARLKREKAL